MLLVVVVVSLVYWQTSNPPDDMEQHTYLLRAQCSAGRVEDS